MPTLQSPPQVSLVSKRLNLIRKTPLAFLTNGSTTGSADDANSAIVLHNARAPGAYRREQ